MRTLRILTAPLLLAVFLLLPVGAGAADITVTAASVKLVSGPTETGTTAEAVAAGQAVYVTTAGLIGLADADASGKDACAGIAINSAASGQPISYAKSGAVVNTGATVVVGTIYVLSATAGGVAPAADLKSTHKTTILGVATTAANIKLSIVASGIAVP